MQEQRLKPEELDLLRGVNSPTIANAVELLQLRGRDEGYADHSIRCMFPELAPVVGYACTATVRSAQPDPHPRYGSLKPYWDHMSKYPAPRIAVVQDLDQPPRGAFWGEVNANIHRALGCVGVVTDGTVRDLDEVRALQFQFLASGISVSHAYCHLDDFDIPVRVGGLLVRPGDLIHADKHGAVLIPRGRVADVLAAVQAIERYERPMIELCKSADFSTGKLSELRDRPVWE